MRAATQDELQFGLMGFINSCVASERRARFCGFVHSAKGLGKWVEQLDHFQRYLDISLATSVASFATPADLIASFRLPAASDVLVVSTLKGMQGVVMSLECAIEETYKMGNGSILCSLSATPTFWFYLGEEAHAQYLFLQGKQL
jgi:hypothetical protein